MKFPKLFGFGRDSADGEADNGPARSTLPELNGFVDVAVGGARERQSIPIDRLSKESFSTRLLPGLAAGVSADFVYTNSIGKFRFAVVCDSVDDAQAHFKLPERVKTIANFSTQRSAMRLDSIVPTLWRYAPGGEGNGPFLKGSLTDLSVVGASLVVGRDLKVGSQVEVRFTLESSPEPINIIGEVMRATKIQIGSVEKSATGIRFHDVGPGGEQAIDKFIHGRQADRRDRGMI